MTPAPGRVPGLDGLRALAVTLVFGFHGQVSWLRGGGLGVDVFFTLSGFLITGLLLAERRATGRLDLRAFWIRRGVRLLPPLAVVCAACLVYAWGWTDAAYLERTWDQVLAVATYHLNWVRALRQPLPFGLLDHAWSLGIEEQFYLAWPIAVLVAARRGGPRTVLGLALAGAAASAALRLVLSLGGTPGYRLYNGLDTHADGLLLGAALAAFVALRSGSLRLPALTGPAGVAVIVALAIGDPSERALERGIAVVLALATLVVILDAVTGGPAGRALGHPVLAALGRVSYGVYLWHWPVILVLTPGRLPWPDPAILGLRAVVTVALATLSWHLLEAPLLRRRPGGTRPLSGAAAAGLASPTT